MSKATAPERPIVSGGKVIAFCQRCGKPVQLNKMIGSLHFCISECKKAGYHLALREEVRGRWWWKRTWRVCDECGQEQKVTG